MSLWLQGLMWDLEDAETPAERIGVYKTYLRHPIGRRLVRQGQIPQLLEAYRKELELVKHPK